MSIRAVHSRSFLRSKDFSNERSYVNSSVHSSDANVRFVPYLSSNEVFVLFVLTSFHSFRFDSLELDFAFNSNKSTIQTKYSLMVHTKGMHIERSMSEMRIPIRNTLLNT